MEDLKASRITLLIPSGQDPTEAEQFAISNGIKVVICKSKDLEIPIKSNSSWFPWWMIGYGWLYGRRDVSAQTNDQSIINESTAPPLPETPDSSEEEDEEPASPKLITAKDLFIETWIINFVGGSEEEANEQWTYLNSDEKNFFDKKAEKRNQNIVKQFLIDYPNSIWSKTNKSL